ncbi:hypothetical protein GIB67_006221 [Kingdonia uniflora]|uniref:Pentatricopeptide repeat-containing protein n=1 Tax=Kingdonia uniflora TaxID=39325 RepID=A0A7J7P546_9MAGN|nr:hypothetical protein GIB67_006221 [Kingdonia uniflora]
MFFYRLLLQHHLKRSFTIPTTTTIALTATPNCAHCHTFAFSSAEEAAAERRRRKRRLRIEPPLSAIRRDSSPLNPRPRPDPNAPRLPDSTSALVGPRLNLHNRVQSHIRAGDLDEASAMARHAVFSSTRPTVFTCNAVIAAMHRKGRYDDAIALFRFFYNQSNIVPNIVSYNYLINVHCDANRVDVALDVCKHILDNAPFSLSPVTYRHLTKGLVDAGRISEAVDLLREMVNKNHAADSLVYDNIISGYLELGNEERANDLFEELRERCVVYDGVVNATFMEWFFKKGMDKEAMESYQGLLDRKFSMTPATGNVLLEVLLKYDKSLEATKLFEHMLDSHKPPNILAVNSSTYNIMVNECFRLGNISDAISTFRKVGTGPGAKPFMMDAAGYNNIIGKFCENGMLKEAEKFFAEMPTRQATPDTYKFFVDAYLKEERIEDVLLLFNKMVFESGVKASAALYNKIFDALLNNGKLEEVADIMGRMGEMEVKPNQSTYELVITGLCKEGRLDHVWNLLCQMVKHRILVSPALRGTVDEAFGKERRIEEIEKLLGRSYDGRVGNFTHQQKGPEKVAAY